MLLTVLVESLPAAARRGGDGLEAACRFIANGALELHDAGGAGVANRVVLHALARLDRALAAPPLAGAPETAPPLAGAPETAPEDGGSTAAAAAPPGEPPPASLPTPPVVQTPTPTPTPAAGPAAAEPADPVVDRRAWPALLHHLFATLPVERDRVLLGYVRRVLEAAVRAGAADPELRLVAAELWTRVVDRALGGVTPGTRSPALDHLLVRLSRLLEGPGALPPTATADLLDRICALPRFTAWWSGWAERHASEEVSPEELPPSLRDVALRALRTAAPGELPAAAARRVRALAAVCGAEDLPHLAAPLTAGPALVRRAAIESLVRLNERLGAAADLCAPIVAALLPLLDDPESDVRRTAVRALGTIPAPSLAAPLVALYQRSADSEQLQRAETLDALVRIAAAHPAAVLPAQVPYLRAERDRHAAMARGPLRDRILAALEKLTV